MKKRKAVIPSLRDEEYKTEYERLYVLANNVVYAEGMTSRKGLTKRFWEEFDKLRRYVGDLTYPCSYIEVVNPEDRMSAKGWDRWRWRNYKAFMRGRTEEDSNE